MHAILVLLAAALLMPAARAQSSKGPDAVNPGDEVVVLYNSNVKESKLIAEHYARVRRVPDRQVFGLALPTTEDMSRGDFRDKLQTPLARWIEKNGLWKIRASKIDAGNGTTRTMLKPVESKIRYLVLCYGVPLRVSVDSSIKEAAVEKAPPEMRRNGASVDSELVLLPFHEEKVVLSGPLANFVYGVTNTAFLHPTNGILLVSRLDGPTPEIANALVDKAMQAETNGLWGRAYFDLRSITNAGYIKGDIWMVQAAQAAQIAGYEVVVDTNAATFPAAFPMSHIALYAGWYDANVSGPFARPNVEFMPGAVAYHLHSYSAPSLRTTNRFWAGPLLDRGVTATMGCVDEPYLDMSPDIGAFFVRLLLARWSFAEAAWAAQPALSWQTTVVGDPLYRPALMPPDRLHADLDKRRSPLVEWSHLKVVNLNLVKGYPPADVIEYLRQVDLTTNSAVLMEKLADIYVMQGDLKKAVACASRALELATSPQQRVRLHLSLGAWQQMLGLKEDAFLSYQAMLVKCPEYPDKKTLYQVLVKLARDLKRPELAQYETQLRLLTQPPSQTSTNKTK
jgi:uncharacterized protein (TIGR03790 family)